MLSFGASWGPVPWEVHAETSPSSLRAKGGALSPYSKSFNNLIIGLINPPFVQNTGFGAYTFFAAFCLLSLLETHVFGRTLKQMDHFFKDIASEHDESRRNASY